MTVLGRIPFLVGALLFLSACVPQRVSYLDDALDRKAAFSGSFPGVLRTLTPRLPGLLAFVDAESAKQGLKGWPDPWPGWKEAGPKDPLLRKVWVNPEATWFCDPFMDRWDVVLFMRSATLRSEGSSDAQIVLVRDAFGPSRSFLTLFPEPRLIPGGCVSWGHPVKRNEVWISSDEAPAWALTPFVYPRQTAVLTTPVDVDWFMRFAYSPEYGIAVWGAWGTVSKGDHPTVSVIGEDDYFVWEKVDGYERARPKDPTMEEMKGPAMLGWTSLP